jgi:2-polyprenyl-3-methyl-5-hydroxy-6-metoxy-1,4-benzoquinol methylase
MIGHLTKDTFDPDKNYESFYHGHKFQPWPEDMILRADEILPRAGWALDTAKKLGYKSFIDLCCLDGFVATTLSHKLGMNGWAVDLSEPGITLLNERIKTHNLPIETYLGPAEDFIAPEKVDMIMMFEATEHFKDTPAVLEQYITYLNPGGSILISTPDLDGTFGDSNEDACHLRVYTYKRGKDAPKKTSLGKVVVSAPDEIEKLGGTVRENQVWNDLIHLRATFDKE